MHRKAFWCERGELNPHGNPLDSKSSASTNSATLAKIPCIAQTLFPRKFALPRPARGQARDRQHQGTAPCRRSGGKRDSRTEDGPPAAGARCPGRGQRRSLPRRIALSRLPQQQTRPAGTRFQHLADLHGHLAPGLQPVAHRPQRFARYGQHDAARGLGVEDDAFHRLIH